MNRSYLRYVFDDSYKFRAFSNRSHDRHDTTSSSRGELFTSRLEHDVISLKMKKYIKILSSSRISLAQRLREPKV